MTQPPNDSATIEQIAIVIYRAAYNPDYNKSWDGGSEASRYKYRKMAKAAIAAMGDTSIRKAEGGENHESKSKSPANTSEISDIEDEGNLRVLLGDIVMQYIRGENLFETCSEIINLFRPHLKNSDSEMELLAANNVKNELYDLLFPNENKDEREVRWKWISLEVSNLIKSRNPKPVSIADCLKAIDRIADERGHYDITGAIKATLETAGRTYVD